MHVACILSKACRLGFFALPPLFPDKPASSCTPFASMLESAQHVSINECGFGVVVRPRKLGKFGARKTLRVIALLSISSLGLRKI
jgi:hypothetical protein